MFRALLWTTTITNYMLQVFSQVPAHQTQATLRDRIEEIRHGIHWEPEQMVEFIILYWDGVNSVLYVGGSFAYASGTVSLNAAKF
jgi:hypothetical protein